MSERNLDASLVKERVSLRDVVAETVGELKSRGGDDLWACCPFHKEDTPSFHVRPARGVYKCFGCGESGDVITFVQKTRGLGFREALQLLAERAGIELASMTDEQRRRQAEVRRSREVLEIALRVFRLALQEPAGRAALDYVRGRGFSDETLARFDIGFIAPDFLRALRAAGADAAALAGAGFTAAFGGRLGFGIRDANGTLVGFGARKLDDGQDGPKYVNTRETPWFAKGRLLYGLDKAARSVARSRRLVVMEGYTDVMMAHQRGLAEAVASMGTSFTADHVRLVRARVSNLVLVFDGDEPGRAAAERAVRRVLEEGVECRVLLLPGDMDPCDWFATRSGDDFDAELERSGLGSVVFLCRRLLEQLDPGQPGGREQVARQVGELAARLIDPLRRTTVLGEIAQACGLDPNLVRRTSGAVRAAPEPLARAAGGASRAPVSATVRCQLVAVAGLCETAGRLSAVRELAAAGGFAQPAASQLLALAEILLEGRADGAVDAAAWLEAAGERSPELRAALEAALLPPPGVLLPSWDDAVAHLRARLADERGRAERRTALARADVASNAEVLQSVQRSLTGPRGRTEAAP
jgi:DNA primase